MSGPVKCDRAVDHTGRKYVYCRKPATWVATDARFGRDYGLCDEHLAEMRAQGLLLPDSNVRPAATVES